MALLLTLRLSVDAYESAVTLNETLAIANLANKLISAGFLSAAQEKCSAGVQIPDHHENLERAITRIREVPDAETKKLEDIIRRAKPKSDFYIGFGRAALAPEVASLGAAWQHPDCTLTITTNGDSLVATGRYEKLSLAALLSGATTMFGAKPREYTQITYECQRHGKAFSGHVLREDDSSPNQARATILGNDKAKPVLMYLSEGGEEFKVMESTIFYALKRTTVAE